MKKEVAGGQPLFLHQWKLHRRLRSDPAKLGKAGIYLQTPVPVRFSFFQVGLNKQNSLIW